MVVANTVLALSACKDDLVEARKEIESLTAQDVDRRYEEGTFVVRVRGRETRW